MPSNLFSPEHWRNRAEEARVLAEQIRDPDAHRQMLDIAAGYDRLAEMAAKQVVHQSHR